MIEIGPGARDPCGAKLESTRSAHRPEHRCPSARPDPSESKNLVAEISELLSDHEVAPPRCSGWICEDASRPSRPRNSAPSTARSAGTHSKSGVATSEKPSRSRRLKASMACLTISTFCLEISPHPLRFTGQVSPISSVAGDAHGVMSSPATSPTPPGRGRRGHGRGTNSQPAASLCRRRSETGRPLASLLGPGPARSSCHGLESGQAPRHARCQARGTRPPRSASPARRSRTRATTLPSRDARSRCRATGLRATRIRSRDVPIPWS